MTYPIYAVKYIVSGFVRVHEGNQEGNWEVLLALSKEIFDEESKFPKKLLTNDQHRGDDNPVELVAPAVHNTSANDIQHRIGTADAEQEERQEE